MLLPIVVALLVLLADQGTKWLVLTRMDPFQTIPVIDGFFSLQFVLNPGAAFGMLPQMRWLLVLVSLAAIVGILLFLRDPHSRQDVVPAALGLLLGGAMGNLLDRLRLGEVVDFLLFYWNDYSFPNFNVADIAITVGVGLFILHLILTREKGQREKI